MAKSKYEPEVSKRLAGESILKLIDTFHQQCNETECHKCIYCDCETEEEMAEFGIEPMRCFAYFIGMNFEVDLFEYYRDRGGELKGNA